MVGYDRVRLGSLGLVARGIVVEWYGWLGSRGLAGLVRSGWVRCGTAVVEWNGASLRVPARWGWAVEDWIVRERQVLAWSGPVWQSWNGVDGSGNARLGAAVLERCG